MKKLYNALYIIVPLFYIGCSTVYTVKDYSSREKFYNKFNESVSGKEVNVKLTNDSLLSSLGAVIVNDTLYSLEHIVYNQYMKIPVSKLKDIEYKRLNGKSATILLTNEKEIKATEIKYSADSLGFYAEYKSTERVSIAVIDKVKEVRYNSHWGNLGTKILAGTALGAATGFTTGMIIDNNSKSSSNTGRPDGSNQGEDDFALVGCVLGVPVGTVIGLIVGWCTGYNYIYKFN
jgi:hypothetical protein